MGMVVRTNTMALNAYRQLGMNNSAVAKSLEKLASGYRINRAGDDAAGLAISEKMKAQITGLETASSNAQDGISLIQTAEGNLNEVHDMLNRMVELATKSANGTYTQTERDALQAEVDQLLEEIDRISESANFNGAKLLDGSLENGGGARVTEGIDRIISDVLGAGEDPVKNTGVKTILDGGSAGSKGTTFEVNFSDLAVQNSLATVAAATVNAVAAVYKSADQTVMTGSGDLTIAGHTVAIDVDNATDLEKQLTAFATDYNTNATNKAWSAAVSDDKKSIVFTAKTAGAFDATLDDTDGTKVPSGALTGTTLVTAGADQIPQVGVGDEITSKIDFKIGNTTLAAGVELDAAAQDGKVTSTEIATAVAKALNNGTALGNGTVEVTLNNAKWDVSLNGDKLKFELKDAPTAANIKGDFDWDVSLPAGSTSTFEGNHTAGTVVTEQGQVGAANAVANTVFKVTASDIKDGTTITIDDVTVTLAVGPDSKYQDAENVVDLTAMDPDNINIDEALGKISEVFAQNSPTNFIVGVNDTSNGDAHQGLTVHKDPNSNETYDTKEKLAAVFSMSTAGSGKALTLQIGDTSEDFNKMSVSIGDMSTQGLKINGLKIDSQEDAGAAINKIKDAINSVSTARAGMGALQNRLEHTINNLDVAAENLSAANSRIRDTDMAKEMMNYTKMNVLVQSAQAMLAQANQQPQSVLQLLQ